MDDHLRRLCLCRHPPPRRDQRQLHRLFRLLLFGWLFVMQGITPFVQGNADSGRGYQDWHLWFLAFPYLYIGHIVLLVFNTIRLLLPPYPPRFVHYAALLLTLLSGWHVGAFMPTA